MGPKMGSAHTTPHSFPMFSVLILNQSLKFPRLFPRYWTLASGQSPAVFSSLPSLQGVLDTLLVISVPFFLLGFTTVSPNLHGRFRLLGLQFILRCICHAIWMGHKQRTNTMAGTSLMVQWLRICLPMQKTQVQFLVQEDSTCLRATRSMCYNYWACQP